MLIKAAGVLWVIRGAHLPSKSPELSIVYGLARSIRSETLLRFATLDLNHRPADDMNVDVTAILHVMRLTWMIGQPSLDMEYTERNGQLLVPRVVDDVDMNSSVQRETQNVEPYSQPFFQPGRPLKLKVGISGALDTLHFADDVDNISPLQPDQVSSSSSILPSMPTTCLL